MRSLTIAHLLDLAASGMNDAEGRIEQMFKWHAERSMAISNAIFGLAGALIVALLVALLEGKVTDPSDFFLAMVFNVALVALGIVRVSGLSSINAEYVSALGLYRRLAELPPEVQAAIRLWFAEPGP